MRNLRYVLVDNFESAPAILAFTESWLDSAVLATFYGIKCWKCYKISFKKQGNETGGGILLQFVKEIDLIEEHSGSIDVSVLAEVRISGNPLLLLIFNNLPWSNKLHFLDQLDHDLAQISRRNKVIVMSDLNIDVLRDEQVIGRFRDSVFKWVLTVKLWID